MDEQLRYLSELDTDYERFQEAIDKTVNLLDNFRDRSDGLYKIGDYFSIDDMPADEGQFRRYRDVLSDYCRFMRDNFYNEINDQVNRIDDERVELYSQPN